jgi:glycosyltransferase involved in cell wall biosynthesis
LRNLLAADSYHISRFYSSAFANKLCNEIKSNKYEVIVLDGLQMAAYLQEIRKSSKAKVILRAHNVEHLIWKRMSNAAVGLKRWYLNLLADRLKTFELEVLHKVDALLPITPDDAAFFRDAGCEKPMHVTPVGVNLDKYRIDESAVEHPTVFHFGSMDWLPNEEAVRWFIDSCLDSLLSELPTLKLEIAGRNMPTWLKVLNHPNVRIVENVSDPVTYMNSRSILIVPLFSGSGMRVKIVEGLAMGKAIVSTTIGAEGIRVEHGKNILLADTPSEFVRAIVSLVNDVKVYDTLRKNARSLAVEQYSSDRIGKETLTFLHSL